MHTRHGTRSFADGGCHALDVADREDSGTIRFQQIWSPLDYTGCVRLNLLDDGIDRGSGRTNRSTHHLDATMKRVSAFVGRSLKSISWDTRAPPSSAAPHRSCLDRWRTPVRRASRLETSATCIGFVHCRAPEPRRPAPPEIEAGLTHRSRLGAPPSPRRTPSSPW